jgi:hypothetical protein
MDTAYQAELDALSIRTNAAREAWGFTVKSNNEQLLKDALLKNAKLQAQSTRATGKAQAISARAGGNAAAAAGNFGAASTVIGATATVLQNQYGFGRS